MARRYCQKVFENKFTVELTIQQSSFKIRSQVLNNRVKNHQTGSSFRATDQKLKILRSSFIVCAIEFYSLRDRVLHFARSSFTFCAIEFYSLCDRVLHFSSPISIMGGLGLAPMVKVKVREDAVHKGIIYPISGVTKRMLFSNCDNF